MGMLSAFLAGFWLNLRVPTGLILKWFTNLAIALLITWPLSQRVPTWLADATFQSPEMIWNQFWLQQGDFISGLMPFWLLLCIALAGLNWFFSGAALGQFAAVTAKERRPFLKGGAFLLPAYMLHTALFAGLAWLWIWYWLLPEDADIAAFFDVGQWSFWVFALGLTLLAYIYEVIRIQVALEGERQVRQGAGDHMAAAFLRAPLLWSIGSLQGLVSLFSKPGLFLIWIVLIGLDVFVFSLASQLGQTSGGQLAAFVGVQLVMLLRVLLDLAFLASGVQYLGKKSEQTLDDI